MGRRRHSSLFYVFTLETIVDYFIKYMKDFALKGVSKKPGAGGFFSWIRSVYVILM